MELEQVLEQVLPILEENINPHEFKADSKYRMSLLNVCLYYIIVSARKKYIPASSIASEREFTGKDFLLCVRQVRDFFRERHGMIDELPKKNFLLFGDLAFGVIKNIYL